MNIIVFIGTAWWLVRKKIIISDSKWNTYMFIRFILLDC